MPPPLRFKTFKTGYRNAVLDIESPRIQLLTERVSNIHEMRTLAHQFAKYTILRSYETGICVPSIFGKNKENGWSAYYSAIAQSITKMKEGFLKQCYMEFCADIHIDKNRFKNLGDQYNSHTAGQSASLCKRHVMQEYTEHVSYFVYAHFCDEIKKRETAEERKILWSCVNIVSDALIGTASKNALADLRAASKKYGLPFVTFLNTHLKSEMFYAFVSAEQRDEMLSSSSDDDDDDDGVSVKATVEEYVQWHKAMWYMSTKIEALNETRLTTNNCLGLTDDQLKKDQLKVRSLMPLVNGICPNHAHLYAKPLIMMLGDNLEAWKKSKTGIHEVWETLFKPSVLKGPKSFTVTNSDGSKERYKFANQVSTDGHSGLSLLFVHPHDYDRHIRNAKEKGEARQRTSRMTPEELAQHKKDVKLQQTQKAKERTLKKKEYEQIRKKAKEEGRKLPKAGIPYFDTLDPNLVQAKRHVYIDSGHYGHDMIDQDFTCDGADRKSHKMVAEQRHRVHAMGTKRSKQIRHMREQRCGLDGAQCDERRQLDAESKYANQSIRFLNYCKAFWKYVSVVSVNDPTYNPWHSYQKLRTYGLRNRYESNLITSIVQKFGDPKNILVIIGDYSATHRPAMRGTVPAFVVGFARLLKRAGFSVAWIDEYNTSKLYHRTHLEGEQAKVEVSRPVDVKDKVVEYRSRWERGKNKKQMIVPEHALVKKVSRKLHAVKLFKTEYGMKAFCNRDTNAVLNFKYIVQYWLEHGTRPSAYCRSNVNPLPLSSLEPMIAS